MRHKIFMWKTLINYEDKKKIMRSKTYQFKSIIQNQVTQIYFEDLHSSTYNLIHVCNATTSCYSLVNPSATSKRLSSSTHDSKIQILE